MNCKKCGNPLEPFQTTCTFCGAPVTEETSAPAVEVKVENVTGGVVGAFIGAVLGGASIVLLAQLGFVAAISGVILAFCTLKGYELLAGRLSTKGIIISIVLMLITPYLADRISWAIELMKVFGEYGLTFGDAFAAVPGLIEEGVIEMGAYLKSLLMVYGFTALGAYGSIKAAVKYR